MDVIDAIEQTEADLGLTLDELRMAKELVATLENDAKKIQIELVGLRSYAQRRGLTRLASEPDQTNIVPISGDIDMAASDRINLALLSRSDAVATVLASAPGPMDRSSIHEQFIDGDRFDSIDDISLSLSGLKRAGRVEKLGQGLWQLAQSQPATGS